jgi:hypothetical protein
MSQAVDAAARASQTRGVRRLLGFVAVAALALVGGSAGEPSANVTAPGMPQFAPPQYLTAIPTTPHFAAVTTMTAADFTGDGLDDVLVTRANWPTAERYQVQLLVNDGDGHLVEQTSTVFSGHIPESVFPYRVVVADFNGDKVPDAFIADTGEDIAPPPGWQSQLILSAPGGLVIDGTARLPQQNAYTYFTDAADVNGDGSVDLYLGNTQSLPPEVLLNDGHGHFSVLPNSLPSKPFASTGEAIDMKTPDLNGDGIPDMLISWTKGNPFYHGQWIQVLIANGDGTFRDETATRLPQVDNVADPIVGLKLIDVNRDGAADIATQLLPQNPPPYDPPPPFYLNNGHGSFTPLPPGDNADAGEEYVFANLDGDGGHDIVYTKDAIHFYVRREVGAPVSTLYASIFPGAGTSLRKADDAPLNGVSAGAYNVVIWDHTKHNGFRLVGPGVDRRTTPAFVGRQVWRVQLRRGAVYRYSPTGHPRHLTRFRIGR